jgi:hypothetical protein
MTSRARRYRRLPFITVVLAAATFVAAAVAGYVMAKAAQRLES